MSPTKCRACGSQLHRSEYQARSADEAHRVVYKCPLCPLDSSKFKHQSPDVHLYLRRLTRNRKKTASIESRDTTTRVFVSVDIKNRDTSTHSHQRKATCMNALDQHGNLFRAYNTGPFTGQCHREIETRKIAPYVSLVYMECMSIGFSVSTLMSRENTYEHFSFRESGSFIEIADCSSTRAIREIPQADYGHVSETMRLISTLGFLPLSLKSCMSAAMLGSLSNTTARAYDATEEDCEGRRISTKPDGERIWISRLGCVWALSRRLLGHSIVGWIVDEDYDLERQYSIGPVVDAELMIQSRPILIDILLDEHSGESPQDRDMSYIVSKFQSLQKLYSILDRVEIRPFFDSLSAARMYSANVDYPIDGLIALSPGSVDMFKLKSIKSIELRLVEKNILESKENVALFRLTEEHMYEEGDILEARILVAGEKIVVQELFQRFDKTEPNDMAAIKSILASTRQKRSKNILRTSIWRWSNRLRESLYERAAHMCQEKRIILDVGSGSGQSVDSIRRLTSVSIIFVEPDEQKCKDLAKRLRAKSYSSSSRSFIPFISQLKRGSVKYHIINATLEELTRDKATMVNLSSIVGCVVGSFSTHYIINELAVLASWKMKFIGSYYSYKDIKIGESIIDSSGLRMKRESLTLASVKWGSDEIYHEPIFEEDELPHDTVRVRATSIVQRDDGDLLHEADRLYSSCQVLILR